RPFWGHLPVEQRPRRPGPPWRALHLIVFGAYFGAEYLVTGQTLVRQKGGTRPELAGWPGGERRRSWRRRRPSEVMATPRQPREARSRTATWTGTSWPGTATRPWRRCCQRAGRHMVVTMWPVGMVISAWGAKPALWYRPLLA